MGVNVMWTSSDSAVVSLESSQTSTPSHCTSATYRMVGRATLMARAGSMRDSILALATVNVGLTDSIPASLRFQFELSQPVEPSGYVTLQARAINKEGYFADSYRTFPYVWSFGDTSIERPGKPGLYGYYSGMAGRPGRTTVTVSLGTLSVSTMVEVHDTTFAATPHSLTVVPGVPRQLLVRRLHVEGPIRQATFSNPTSSAPGVATMDSDGVIRAVSTGTATVGGTYRGQLLTAKVFAVTYPQPLRFTQIRTASYQFCGMTADGAVY